MQQPTVLISGATSGIGRATAIFLADRGYRVFAGVHDPAHAGDFKGRMVEPLALDVTEEESIAAAIETVRAAVGDEGLQAVVNNAGIAAVGPLEYLPVAEVKRVFDVNLFGALALTQAALPLLRDGRGRIVMISSVVAHLALPFASPVSASKAALHALSTSLRLELHEWGIPVALIEPGSIDTPVVARLRAAVAESLDALPAPAQERYRGAVESMIDKQMQREEGGSDPSVVGAAVYKALTEKRPSRRYPVGADAHLMLGIAKTPEAFRDEVVYRVFGLGGEAS
jgi:NAD(P)-dependent dehydrogenase (short-subunit alcohol dehydrogenase family)